MPEKGKVRIDAALTNVAIDYYNNQMTLAKGMALPFLPVNDDSGKYYTFDKKSFRLASSGWSPGSKANEITPYTSSTESYSCEKKKLKSLVTDDEVNQADQAIEPRTRVTKKVKDNLDTELEYNIASTLQDTSNFSNDTVSNAWSGSSATIFEDVKDAIRSVEKSAAVAPNTMVINPSDFDDVQGDADIKDRVKYTQGDTIAPDQFGNLVDIDNVVVPKAVYNSSDEGQADSMSYCFSSGKVVLLYVPEMPSLWEPSAGYIMAEKLYGGENVRVRRYRADEDREGDYVEVSRSYDIVTTASEAGYIIDIT